ncbi:MAG: hypothetical protein KC438_02265 [Thermomicrobiales bacterium]|nr:hypothetical protein [Thermomicrobiales bacterium]MCO5221551.1 hypothetical protein [Thermomicrobiales bacterium]
MVTPIETQLSKPPLFDENARIPRELNATSKVYELNTIKDAREALARLRELRRDFEASTNGRGNQSPASLPPSLPGKGEDMLAGLSNIQRMRTIRSEIAFLEDLMVRIAEREFLIEEQRHHSYLSSIGQWSTRERGRRPVI